MRRISGLAPITTFFILFTMLLTACGGTSSGGGGTTSSSSSGAKAKVALVTDIGGLNDRSFNQLAYGGYTQAQKQYGFTPKVIQTQSQNDYVKNLTLASQSVGPGGLVIAVGFLMQVPLDQIAKQNTTINYAIVDGCALTSLSANCDPLSNVSPLFFKEEQAGCLVGAVAGQMELDGKAKVPNLLGANSIGAVGGIPVPPVVRYIAGYKYCAKKVDPNVKVYVNYSQDFVAAAKCKDAALSQINQHQADIIFQVAGQCGLGALDAANSKNVYGIGVDADQGYLYPSVITSAQKRVNVAVYTIIDLAEKGKYSNNLPKFDLTNNGVTYSPPNAAVPADAKATADAYAAQIKAGSLVVPENIPSPNTP
ncbi:MAG: BMP family ABC transporter substrate-binding protein [Chloroflexi bacterium]|nr:MAG: BMP family ABC transporter substrate-binding protein [Chloroflexota bacterium]